MGDTLVLQPGGVTKSSSSAVVIFKVLPSLVVVYHENFRITAYQCSRSSLISIEVMNFDPDVERQVDHDDDHQHDSKHGHGETQDRAEESSRTSPNNIPLTSTNTSAAANPTPLTEKSPKTDANLVVWDGTHDPENPQNFPQWKKWMITWLLGFLNIWVTFSSTIFASAVAPTAAEYHVSTVVTTLGVSLMVLVRLHRGRNCNFFRSEMS